MMLLNLDPGSLFGRLRVFSLVFVIVVGTRVFKGPFELVLSLECWRCFNYTMESLVLNNSRNTLIIVVSFLYLVNSSNEMKCIF